MVRVLALRERFEHISKESGYDALFHHLPADIRVDSVFCNFKKMYPRGIGRIWQTAAKYAHGSSSYNAQSAEAELKLFSKLIAHRYDLVHYTHAEPYLGFGARRIKMPIVATNHQPVSWWKQNTALFEKYENVKQVICLTDFDRDYFNEQITGKAVCIPHGVDTEYYHPLNQKKENEAFTIIFSGRYLRDVATLAKAVIALSSLQLKIRFDIVYTAKSTVKGTPMEQIAGLPDVTWHTNVPEEDLRRLYQNADCCMIPLLDCTANNAILEAMACGLPLISTDLAPIRTYLDKNNAVMGRSNNAGDLVAAVEQLYNDKTQRAKMAVASRRRAVELFDWKIIAGQTARLFTSLS
jgi:glycosyltransferase involved in cell wall biosynthesis